MPWTFRNCTANSCCLLVLLHVLSAIQKSSRNALVGNNCSLVAKGLLIVLPKFHERSQITGNSKVIYSTSA